MSERIQIVYDAVTYIIEQVLLNNDKFLWPESYLSYKSKIKNQEVELDISPISNWEWYSLEHYIYKEYNLFLPKEEALNFDIIQIDSFINFYHHKLEEIKNKLNRRNVLRLLRKQVQDMVKKKNIIIRNGRKQL